MFFPILNRAIQRLVVYVTSLLVFSISSVTLADNNIQLLNQAEQLSISEPKKALKLLADIPQANLDDNQSLLRRRIACDVYIDMGLADKALFASDVSLSNKYSSEDAIRLSLCRSAAHQRLGEVRQALLLIDQAIKFANTNDNQPWIAKSLMAKGEHYSLQGEQDEAFKQFSQAYQIASSLNNNKVKHDVLNSLATVYYNTGRLALAEQYYEELVGVAETTENLSDLSVALFNLAHAYASQQKFVLADESFARSLQLSDELNDALGSAYTLKSWAESAQAQGDSSAAKKRLSEALSIFQLADDQKQLASVQRHLGDIALSEGEYQQALTYYRSALPVLERYNFQTAMTRTYRGMSEAYAALGDYNKAYIIHQAYTLLLKESLEQQNVEATKRFQAQFETQKISDTNKRLNLKNERQQIELEYSENRLMALSLFAVLALIIIALIVVFWRKTRHFALEMQKLATVDELTQLPNRRAILEFGESEWHRAERFERPFSCMIFDIDHFKSVNDTYGHAIGDEVLKGVAMDVQSELRKTDSMGRFGGEEFLVIAGESDLAQAKVLAERIREAVASTDYASMPGRQITVSIGVVMIGDEKDLHDLIQHADEALYYAKEHGRNRVVSYPLSN